MYYTEIEVSVQLKLWQFRKRRSLASLTSLLVSTVAPLPFPRRSLLQVVLMSATINCREFGRLLCCLCSEQDEPSLCLLKWKESPFQLRSIISTTEHVHHSRVLECIVCFTVNVLLYLITSAFISYNCKPLLELKNWSRAMVWNGPGED